jgi:hypothetical protein
MKEPLEPWQIREMQDEHRLGIGLETLALRHNISLRTVNRYINARVERVYVDGWTAWFALHSDERSPQRLTGWEPA